MTDWSVALKDVNGPASVLVLLPERLEAEDLAIELRRRGQNVVVRPYRTKP